MLHTCLPLVWHPRMLCHSRLVALKKGDFTFINQHCDKRFTHMQTQIAYVIISIQHHTCSKQVYIGMHRQGMIDQNQVPNNYNGERLWERRISVPIMLHSPWSVAKWQPHTLNHILCLRSVFKPSNLLVLELCFKESYSLFGGVLFVIVIDGFLLVISILCSISGILQ